MKYPASLSFFAACGLGVLLGGAVENPLPARAQAVQVDASTPKTQGGLTLLAVVRGDAQGQYHYPIPANLNFLAGPTGSGEPGGIGLWIKAPALSPPPRRAGSPPRPFVPAYAGMPTVTAQGPGGETLPAQCNRAFAPQSGMPTGPMPVLYLVTIPGGYPAGYGPINIELMDTQGHHAHWRLSHPPPSYHAIVEPVTPHSTFSGDGVRLTVSAWQEPGPSYGGSRSADFGGVRYLIQSKLPSNSHWLVRITKRQLEWEPLSPAQQAALPPYYPLGRPRPPLFTALLNPVGLRSGFPGPQDFVRTPYAAHDHYLRLEGQLVQIATTEEPVTFHNLTVKTRPNPFAGRGRVIGPHGVARSYVPPPSYEIVGGKQTVTTPSGVSLTFLPFSLLPNGEQGFGGFGDGAAMLLKFGQSAPGSAPVVLPRSPLYRRYHKPVAITLRAEEPLFLENMFPVGPNYFPGRPSADQVWMTTLRNFSRPVPHRLPNGQMVFSGGGSTLPPHLDHLTLTVTEQAELRTIPISFLVPIARQAPAAARPASFPMRPLPRPNFRPGPPPRLRPH